MPWEEEELGVDGTLGGISFVDLTYRNQVLGLEKHLELHPQNGSWWILKISEKFSGMFNFVWEFPRVTPGVLTRSQSRKNLPQGVPAKAFAYVYRLRLAIFRYSVQKWTLHERKYVILKTSGVIVSVES